MSNPLIPIAVSSQLDVTGEEKIHAANYELVIRPPFDQNPEGFDPNLVQVRYLFVPFGDTSEAYADPLYDDSSWLTSLLPFGSDSTRPDVATFGLPDTRVLDWPSDQNVWVRGIFTLTAAADKSMDMYFDNYGKVWVNNNLIGEFPVLGSFPFYFHNASIGSSYLNVGSNVVAVKGRADFLGINTWLTYRITAVGGH